MYKMRLTESDVFKFSVLTSPKNYSVANSISNQKKVISFDAVKQFENQRTNGPVNAHLRSAS